MNKLLCIVGPTATGKTARAIKEAGKTPSIIISADSRQVYRGMDIVTGKDHPANVPIFGIDIVDPDQSISVAVWYDAVMPHIEQAWDEGKQVIVVGGTGLYVKALTTGIASIKVPIDQSLRTKLSSLAVPELQEILNNINQSKFTSMNNSDQNNPRRLIRAIEVAISPSSPLASNVSNLTSNLIGLKYSDLSIQRNKIVERVKQRLQLGAVREAKELLKKYGRDLQSMSAIGYKSIIEFLDDKLSERELVESWVAAELAYAKRQLTWFNKQPVIWYDA